MSFTQRAKKKLVSLSKRKKSKTSEKEQIRPPIQEVPRVPFHKDSQRNLSSSMSLPDQLDQSEATNVSKISSKSLSSIETASQNVTLLSYVSDTTCKPRVLTRLNSTPLPPSKYRHTDSTTHANQNELDVSEESPSINAVSSVSKSLDDNVCQQTASRKNTHMGKLSLMWRHGHSLDYSLFPNNQHIDLKEGDYSLWSSPPPGEGFTENSTECQPSRAPGEGFTDNNANECQFPACLVPANNRRSHRSFSASEDTDESRSMEGDLGVSEEDSEVCDEVFKNDSVDSAATFLGSQSFEPCSSNNTNIACSTNNFRDGCKDEGCEQQKTRSLNSSKQHCVCNSEMDDSQINIHGRPDATKVSRTDSSVVKKIRFFESYNRSTNSSDKQSIKVLTEIQDNTRPALNDDLDARNILNKHTEITSDDAGDGGRGSYKVNQPKNVASHRVFPNSASARQRLNFSRFKRSDSIPEVVAVCTCGDLCQGGCDPSGHDRVSRCQCTEANDDMPLMLCSECDLEIHKNHSDHLVLDTRQTYDFTEEQNNQAPYIDVDDVDDRGSQLDIDNTCNELDDDDDFVRNKTDNSHSDQELSTTMTMKNESYNNLESVNIHSLESVNARSLESVHARSLESPSKKRTGSDGQIVALTRLRKAENSDHEDQKSATLGRNSSLDGSPTLLKHVSRESSDATTPALNQGSLRGKNISNYGSFSLRFVDSAGREQECVQVSASPNKSLSDAIEPVLQARNMDIRFIDVFIEKSQTPLYMSCDTVYLAGNILEVKEKENKNRRDKQVKKSESRRGIKTLERSSRRDSFGLVTPLSEPHSVKHRRGSLPFREHFFTRSDSKTEGSKTADDTFGSIRGVPKGLGTFTDDPATPTTPTPSSAFKGLGRSSKMPKLGSINKEKERQEHLIEILNRYSQNGLPPFPELLDLGRKKFDDTMFYLESSWKVIVENHEGLSKKQHEHQEAVWELLHTEVSYIKQIRVIIEVFQNCLMNTQLESFLNEIESERLFSNIDKIYECNCLFWQQHLLPILQSSRESRLPLDPLLSKEGFVDHFPILFQVYFKYFIEHKSCLDYAKACMDNSDLFRTFVQWAETQKQCNRLRFSDILGQPMPRLLKYSLLLRAILKYTERDNDRMDLKAMIQSVEKLCGAANNSLRRIEEYKRLEAVRKTLEPFDSIEAPNDECAKIIQGFIGNFNLLAPMPGFRDGPRSLLFQSSLRMKEGQNVKMDVECLLFTDLLLICKSNRKMERFKIIRPPMRLNHLIMSELKDRNSFMLIYMNEYNVPLSAFTLHSDPGSIRGWVEKFREAQKDFKAKEIQTSSVTDRLRSDTSLTQSDLDDMSLSALSYLDLGTSAICRSESSNSLDHFVPNVLTASEAMFNTSQPEVSHSTSMPNFKSVPSGLSIQSHDRIEPAVMKLVLPSGGHDSPFTEDADVEASDGSVHRHADKHRPTYMVSMSAPIGMDGNSSIIVSDDTIDLEPAYPFTASNQSYMFKDMTVEGQPLSDISNELDPQAAISAQTSPSGEDIVNTKLNSRRTEKRYHTADEIPDILNSQKDPGIQKWSSLRKDVQLSDLQDLGSTVLSTDSVQSYQSSSGVSSNGSLHLAVEISEDNSAACDGDVSIDNHLTNMSHPKHISDGDSADISDVFDFTDGGSTKSYLSEPRPHFAESKHAKSKSTSDLVEMFGNSLQVSQMTDGIASVAVTPENMHRKLTQLDILKLKKMKHQILFDANVESSEV